MKKCLNIFLLQLNVYFIVINHLAVTKIQYTQPQPKTIKTSIIITINSTLSLSTIKSTTPHTLSTLMTLTIVWTISHSLITLTIKINITIICTPSNLTISINLLYFSTPLVKTITRYNLTLNIRSLLGEWQLQIRCYRRGVTPTSMGTCSRARKHSISLTSITIRNWLNSRERKGIKI